MIPRTLLRPMPDRSRRGAPGDPSGRSRRGPLTLAAVTILAIGWAAGCAKASTDADGAEGKASLACPEGHEVKGGDGPYVWCVKDGVADGPWQMRRADGSLWVEGRFDEGARRGPIRVLDDKGVALATVDPRVGAGTLTVRDEAGELLGTAPTAHGTLADHCPDGTVAVSMGSVEAAKRLGARTAREGTEGAGGARARFCERRPEGGDGPGVLHGPFITERAGGDVESRSWFVEGRRQGSYELFHPNGKPWVYGEYHLGKAVGVWFRWDAEGTPYAPRAGAQIVASPWDPPGAGPGSEAN